HFFRLLPAPLPINEGMLLCTFRLRERVSDPGAKMGRRVQGGVCDHDCIEERESVLPRPMTADRLIDVIQLLDDARLIVMILDDNGVISFVNDYGRRASGVGAIELAPRALIDAMIED